MKLGSYANALRVIVVLSVSTPERLHGRIQVCFQRNASLALCQCENDDWKAIHKGIWSSVMSPYENRCLDVNLTGEGYGCITVSIVEGVVCLFKELTDQGAPCALLMLYYFLVFFYLTAIHFCAEPQQWRFISLGMGFLILLLAPVVSSWVPFYYSSSMAIGVLLVIILLFQLLPTGRKNAFYLTLYGSMLGAGSFLMHQFSMMVNALLVNFGLSEEMHNLVSLFLLVGIIISGAALGYWMVWKFLVSEDGSVDVGIVEFVEWAIHILAALLILQSTLDTLLALGALFLCSNICFLISSPIWHEARCESCSFNWSPPEQWSQRTSSRLSRAEFLARAPAMGPQSKLWNRQNKSVALLDSPVKGVVSSSVGARRNCPDYCPVLGKILDRRKFSEQEWEDSKAHWTRQAVSDLVSSPEFTDWAIDHADRIKFVSSDSSDEAVGSDPGPTDEVTTKSSNRVSPFSFW